MAGLRRLFDHSFVLANDPSPGEELAIPRAIALPPAGPVWMLMWVGIGLLTSPLRRYHLLFDAMDLGSSRSSICDRHLSVLSRRSALQLGTLGGLPEVRAGHRDDRLIITGIRSRVRHPVYLGHLCEMLAWSVGTGLAVCWLLTVTAVATGLVMIRLEDAELENRFGADYVAYRQRVHALLPKLRL